MSALVFQKPNTENLNNRTRLWALPFRILNRAFNLKASLREWIGARWIKIRDSVYFLRILKILSLKRDSLLFNSFSLKINSSSWVSLNSLLSRTCWIEIWKEEQIIWMKNFRINMRIFFLKTTELIFSWLKKRKSSWLAFCILKFLKTYQVSRDFNLKLQKS